MPRSQIAAAAAAPPRDRPDKYLEPSQNRSGVGSSSRTLSRSNPVDQEGLKRYADRVDEPTQKGEGLGFKKKNLD